jgi:D-alanyl-D-alanine carboxypeptidase
MPTAIPVVFSELSSSPYLADPSMMVVDASTGEVVYERNSTQARKPASVMKLLSAASVLSYMPAETTFTTTVSLASEPDTVVLSGQYDPWISLDQNQAVKMKRTSLPYLAFNMLSNAKEASGGSLKKLTIKEYGIFPQDLKSLSAFLKKRGVTTVIQRVKVDEATADAITPVVTSTSTPLDAMVKFALTWSDNSLAEKLARLASITSGNSFDESGVQQTFHTVLTNFGIDPDKIEVSDGSGLSKENRVTASAIATLLLKVRNDPKFASLYDGLPVGGVSGTLQDRFLTTAPQAVGLVRAKTGTLSGTVSLAGYVDSGDRQYIFVAIADRIARSGRATKNARNTLDRIVGRIAYPIFPDLLPPVISPVATTEPVLATS